MGFRHGPHNGHFIHDSARDLWMSWKTDRCIRLEIPAISVILADGQFWCFDNRRLAIFKMLQSMTADMVSVRCRVQIAQGSYHKVQWKHSTINNGLGVAFGSAPGV